MSSTDISFFLSICLLKVRTTPVRSNKFKIEKLRGLLLNYNTVNYPKKKLVNFLLLVNPIQETRGHIIRLDWSETW